LCGQIFVPLVSFLGEKAQIAPSIRDALQGRYGILEKRKISCPYWDVNTGSSNP
jgi:hypothetical protein